MKFLRRLRAYFRREHLEAEMSEEMRAHLEMQEMENRARGMAPDEARDAARRQFGGVEQVKERAREQRGWVWLEQTGQDLRFAVRMLGKTPIFTVTAVLTLALGIGVNAALFAVYDIATLRPLPSRDPDQLVEVRGRGDEARFSYPDYLDYRAGTQAFASLAAVRSSLIRLPDELASDTASPLEAGPGVIEVQAVSGNYLSTLGAEMALGRDFLPAEAGQHAGLPVMVLSHLFWETYFHGDPGVIGRTLAVPDRQGSSRMIYTIVGVTAPEFVGQRSVPPAAWVPLTAFPARLEDRTRPFLSLIGRMRPGVSRSQAAADLRLIKERLIRLYPEEVRASRLELVPGMRLTDFVLNPLYALAVAPVLLSFALVLVIACLNVANVLLARGIARQHEIGVRLVLGAGRARLVRQLFVENFLLCLGGAGGALLLAIWTLRALKPVLLTMLAGAPEARNALAMVELGLDGRIVAFGAILAGVAGLAAGLIPALHSVRRDGFFALKHDGSVFGRRMTPSRLRSLLLVGQVAVCMTLLTLSGIMTGKLLKAHRGETGFSTEGVYQVAPALVASQAMWSGDLLGAVETLRTLPGVVSAGLVRITPLSSQGSNVSSALMKVAGGPPDKIDYNRISAGFFETFGIPLRRGRAFTPHDLALDARVAIVSESTAESLWPGRSPIGQFLSIDNAPLDPSGATKPDQSYRDYEVIGVAQNIKSSWSREDGQRLVWLPQSATAPAGRIFLRVQADSLGVLRAIERAAQDVGLPLQFQGRLSMIVDQGVMPYRAFAGLSAALSGLALVLATVGLYGVTSFGVNQRVTEIGVRLALGATAARVTALFVRQGMRLVAWGVACGLAGGTAMAVLLSKALPGARFISDPVYCGEVFAVVTLFLIGVALLGCWLPARRAAKVDPMVALRAE